MKDKTMNKAFHEENRSHRSRYGIRWKMYAILIVFVGVALGVIWFFQAQTLNYFYQANKFSELEKTSLLIGQELYDYEGAEEVVSLKSSEYNENIWICKIKNDRPRITCYSQSTLGVTNKTIETNLNDLYEKATENEGRYIALVGRENLDSSAQLKIIADNMGDPSELPYIKNGSDRLHAIFVTIKDTPDDTYMIIQSTSLMPVAAVSSTIRTQFICIGIILGLVALLTAIIMSNIITKPIVTMNEAAKKLAVGEYGADFSVVSGYREMDELGDSLNYAARELAKIDNLQKELISNISHDLRTPLTMIKGYSEVMRDIPGENTAENIQIVIDETSRLSELVNDMLDLSKIQAGTRRPDMHVFSLTQTVRETMQRYERLIKQDGYIIEFYADNDACVYADRGMILQVVYNLINNAINYTGEDKRTTVKQSVNDGRVKISVTDTGEGIAQEHLNDIWNRYYRVDKVHRRATVGTGLGLSIVKEILELHGADFGVESDLGGGSTFWFELAVEDTEPDIVTSDYIEADYEEQDLKNENITK